MTENMRRWIENQRPDVVKNVNSQNVDGVLHMSDTPTIRKFIPRLPESVKKSEDRTIARVCCALDLQGCFYGVPHHLEHHQERLYLYHLPVDEVVVPNKKLSGVAVTDGEVWVVPHRLSNWEIKPTIVGFVYLTQIHHSGDSNTYATYLVNLLKDDRGNACDVYYRAHVKFSHGDCTVTDVEICECKPTLAELESAKNGYSVTGITG